MLDLKILATELTRQYDKLTYLECDGLTRVLHTVLTDANVGHMVCLGKVSYQQPEFALTLVVEPHLWIELEGSDGDCVIVDYRLRMWLGEAATVPHGVFDPVEYSGMIEYAGKPIYLSLLDKSVFQVMTDPTLNLEIAELLKDYN